MAIDFEQVPSNIRVPGFYAEVDPTRAGSYAENLRSIIIGYCLSAKNATQANKLQLIQSADEASNIAGWGSMLARQVKAFRDQNAFGELWVYPVAEPSGGTAATGSITFSGTSTGSGSVYLYIGGERIVVPIPTGTTAADVATLVRKYIQRTRNSVDLIRALPVTITNIVDSTPTAVLTITAKNKGLHGNAIDVRLNYGVSAGEKLPPGISASVTAMSGGAGEPASIDTILAGIGDEPFEYIITPFCTQTQLADFSDWMEERWGPMKQLYGTVWGAKSLSSVSALATYGESLNYPRISIAAYKSMPAWDPEVGAAYGGVASRYFSNNPARQLSSLPLVGIRPPLPGAQFTTEELNTLLYSGLTPLGEGGGETTIVRSITTYQVNTSDAETDAYLETTRNPVISAVLRRVGNMVRRKYSRVILVSDAAVIGAGQAVVSPKRLKNDMIVQYEAFCRNAWCRAPEVFENQLRVERNQDDPTRLDVLYPIILTSPLNIVATKLQFRF